MVNDTEPESILTSQIFSIYCHRPYLFILLRVNGGKWSLFLSSSLTYINGGRDRYFDGDYTSCKIKSVFKKKKPSVDCATVFQNLLCNLSTTKRTKMWNYHFPDYYTCIKSFMPHFYGWFRLLICSNTFYCLPMILEGCSDVLSYREHTLKRTVMQFKRIWTLLVELHPRGLCQHGNWHM